MRKMTMILVFLMIAAAATAWGAGPYAVKVPGKLVGKPKVNVNQLKLAQEKINIVAVKPVANTEAVTVEVKNIGSEDIAADTLQITLFNRTTSGLKKVDGTTKTNMTMIKRNKTSTFYCVYHPCHNGNALVVRIINKKNNLLVATKTIGYSTQGIKVTQFDLVKVNDDSYKLIYRVSNPTAFTVRIHVWAQAISTSSSSIAMYNKYIYINDHTQKQDTHFINTGAFTKAQLIVRLPYPYNCGGSGEIELFNRYKNKP